MTLRSDRTPQATANELPGEVAPAGNEMRGWYLHPKLEAVLRETHGVMIYQEDVLQVAHALAGMSLGQADTLRRSMSGKLRSPEAMAQVRDGFIAGCLAGGIGRRSPQSPGGRSKASPATPSARRTAPPTPCSRCRSPISRRTTRRSSWPR